MSPAPAKTSDAEILQAARTLVAENGVASLTLRDVANAVGIRAPSLYKRFSDRNALISAIRDQTFGALLAALKTVPPQSSATGLVRAFAYEYRLFAHANPELYRLLYSAEFNSGTPEAERRAAEPVITLMQELAGPENALNAARAVTALVHGFCIMEINGNFRLGGSTDEAFEYAISNLISGLQA